MPTFNMYYYIFLYFTLLYFTFTLFFLLISDLMKGVFLKLFKSLKMTQF